MPARVMDIALAACLTTTCLLLAFASTAIAAPGPGGGGGSAGSSGGVITAQVSYRTEGGGSSGGGDGCSWRMVDGGVAAPDLGDATWPRTVGEVTFHLWERRCGGQVSLFQFPEATPEDLLPDLLERLQETLPAPEPVFELLDAEFGWAYVQTPLDYRAGGDSWRPVSVTASIGPVWATVSAVPGWLTFYSGDPAGVGSVWCDGDGPVAPYVAEVPGACSYIYRNASSTSPYDGYHFWTTMTIDWEISWTSSSGAGGPLEGYRTEASSELAVAEVKALVICTGPHPLQGGC